jgi:hypothetical protein
MLVKFNIGYDTTFAEVSVTELDAFVKVVRAMQMVVFEYDNNQYVKKNEKIRVNIEILTHVPKIVPEHKDANLST